MFIVDVPVEIPQVTVEQQEIHAFLNKDVNMVYYGIERNNERVWIQFLIQANTFKVLSNSNVPDFVKANYVTQAIRNFEAYQAYSK